MIRYIYKIISKLLVDRLRKVIGTSIDESQTTFTSEKEIIDGVFVTNATLKWLKKKIKRGIILKLDFQKSYDTVRCDFLKYIMECMCFVTNMDSMDHEVYFNNIHLYSNEWMP